jgi:GTP-binding protein EngB required for normal cell division
MDWLAELHIPAWVMATKADKVGRNDLARRLSAIQKLLTGHAKLERDPLPFSAVTGQGRDQLIAGLIDSRLLF